MKSRESARFNFAEGGKMAKDRGHRVIITL
jgi:hypothetical protein